MDQDSKNLAILNWVLTIFFGFVPGLILYLVKTDNPYVKAHAVESLNWSITAIIGYAIATVLTFVVIGVLLFPVIGICHLIFCILGALAASKGEDYRCAFAIRLIK